MEKIKQNPKRVFAIVAGVLFIAALLFMLLPGLKCGSSSEYGISDSIVGSLFAFAFGGNATYSITYLGETVSEAFKLATTATVLVAFILLIISIVVLIVLVYGLLSEKFNKKTNITLSIIAVVLVIVSSILIFASKEAMLRSTAAGFIKFMYPDITVTSEMIDESVKAMKENSNISLGAGAIVSPIMMLLGAGSLGGVICLSAKE